MAKSSASLKRIPLEREVRAAAARHGLEPDLVAAVCSVESSFDPVAVRFEPRIYERLLAGAPPRTFAHACTPETERVMRACSWGLMQVLGETARALGATYGYLNEMCLPVNSLEMGCLYLAKQRDRYLAEHGWEGVIGAYNAGRPRYDANGGELVNDDYVQRVLERRKEYAP